MTPERQAAEAFAALLPHLTPEEVPVRLAEVMGALVAREVQRERERCAKIVEQFDATDTDGEFVVPGLAVFDDRCQRYVPQVGAIAAHIRASGTAAGGGQ